jgi:acyl-coenzyme A synthetase/AMP-(fatty) acid ligase
MTFAYWSQGRDRRQRARCGGIVCLMLPSSADFAVCYLAAMRLGAIVLWAAASWEAWTAAAAEESTGRNRLLGRPGWSDSAAGFYSSTHR